MDLWNGVREFSCLAPTENSDKLTFVFGKYLLGSLMSSASLPWLAAGPAPPACTSPRPPICHTEYRVTM